MTKEEKYKLTIISAYTQRPLTEEQMEFACDFTKDTISFSDPGTGKTHTLIAGLIMAQQYHKVPGDRINCMSFTNPAVNEMSGRYKAACKAVGITPTVKFNTFHSLSNRLMKEAYPSMTIIARSNLSNDLKELSDIMEKYGVPGNDYDYVKKVLKCINNLNSSLTFHPDSVARKYDFMELDLDVDTFQELRKEWFIRGIMDRTIVQGDIPLYCLYALMKKPEIIKKWKGVYKIMVVDEFQDLSLLHLQILSYIAETLIVIGDMKQQIYMFNGACPQIVQAYLKMHPDARVCNLTKSWRCQQAIADFATRVILPNDRSIQCFKGNGDNGSVTIESRKNMNWRAIIGAIAKDIEVNRLGKARDVMFLYRNNTSAVPIIEELYRNKVPYQCPKFTMIMDVPIFSDLCKLANVAWQHKDLKFVEAALRIFPEFKKIPFSETPGPLEVMRQTGKGLLDINYRYKEDSSVRILNAIMVAKRKIQEHRTAGVVLNNLLQVYTEDIIRGQWWRFDNTKDFYFNLVAPICNTKEYPVLYNEELDKFSRNEECMSAGVGIRCFTMHSAKGLEADDVYILDCDEGMFPNAKVMKKKIQAQCYYDLACDIRSERNLLYVAVTRAKDNVIITYSGESPTSLIANPDGGDLCKYDQYYEDAINDYDDAAVFFELFNCKPEEPKTPTKSMEQVIEDEMSKFDLPED